MTFDIIDHINNNCPKYSHTHTKRIIKKKLNHVHYAIKIMIYF